MDKITRIKKSSRITEIIIGGVALIAMFVFLATSEIASRTVLNAIILCGKSLIPAIFPFLVLCGVLIRLGFPEKATKSIGKTVEASFGCKRILRSIGNRRTALRFSNRGGSGLRYKKARALQ